MRLLRKLAILLVLWIISLVAIAAVTQIDATFQIKNVLPIANGGTNTTTGYPNTTTFQTQITGNVTLGTNSYTASSGTFPAVTTLAAGTWLVNTSLSLQTTSLTGADNLTCEIFDGTNVIAQSYTLTPVTTAAAAKNFQMSMVSVVTEAAGVTFTARCTSSTASQLMLAAAGANSGGNFSSTINAVRIK